MPQDVKAAGPQGGAIDLSAILGDEAPSLQGLVADAQDEQALLEALEKAFDYRGDVTLTLESGETVTGYVFDRRRGPTLRDSRVRLLVAGKDDPVVVAMDRIARVAFTGRDAAHGKSFETWLRKFVEKKLGGCDAGSASAVKAD